MQKEIDCFVTKGEATEYSDEYAGSVWSVDLVRPIAAVHNEPDTGYINTSNGIGISGWSQQNDLTGPGNWYVGPYTRFVISAAQGTAPKGTSPDALHRGRVITVLDQFQNGDPIEISMSSTHYFHGGSNVHDAERHVLEPGQTYYMMNKLVDTNFTFGLCWKPFEGIPQAWNVIDFGSGGPNATTPPNLSLCDDAFTGGTVEVATPTFDIAQFDKEGGIEDAFRIQVREKQPVAYVVNRMTSWIMTSNHDAPLSLDVGDHVRVGTTTGGGFTDYATVLEKVKITQLGCGILREISVGDDDTSVDDNHKLMWQGVRLPVVSRDNSTTADGVARTPDALIDEPHGNSMQTYQKAQPRLINLPSAPKHPYMTTGDSATYAYRLSTRVNCTLPGDSQATSLLPNTGDFVSGQDDAARQKVLMKERNRLRQDPNWATNSETMTRTPGKRGELQRWYPLFKMRNTLQQELVVPLLSVKCVHDVRLVSYSFVGTEAEYQHHHEAHPVDWVAVELGGVQGDVMSNNAHANGAFAILHSGQIGSGTVSGALEHYETNTIARVKFEQAKSTMRELRVKFKDARGEVPIASRIHLWFKLTVTQG